MAFTYPPARRGDVVDDYHGTEIADPYRWLEEVDAADTKAFVEAQNAVSAPYLASLPDRAALIDRMTELWDIPRTEPPRVRGEGDARVMVWSHNDGLADQPTIWIRRGDADPDVLLDPNTLSEDGAVAVTGSALSEDGRLFAYLVAEAGSDRQYLAIRSTETGADLDDRLEHLRFTSIAWFGDGFFYTRWPEVEPGSTAPVRDPSVHYHRVGTPQADDPLVFHNDDDAEPIYSAGLTEDRRYLVLAELLGTDRRNGLLYLDLDTHGASIVDGAAVDPAGWVQLVAQGEAAHEVVLHVAGDDGSSRFVVQTDRDAPNGRLVTIDLADPDPAAWTTIVAETEQPLEWAAALAGEVIVNHLAEASSELTRHAPDGTELGRLDLPGVGSVTGLAGRFTDPVFFIGYQSFVEPPTVLRVSEGASEVWAASEAPIDPADVIVERLHATSTDGAQVGMFVIRHKDAALPGPVELYGYGGFTINLTPAYSPSRLAFLEAGGIVAIANLRGGSEHGETWHEQGALGNKQQVFDDFVACGRHLIDRGVATADTLGIRGGSNGGLLTAATMLQAPELFGAVITQVPVIDMLRFQHFTAGRFWTVEYGDAADPEAFEWLIEYSPLHNVAEGVDYPPLLIMTAESDDRVVPMHSHKFAAEVQFCAGGSSDNPLIERVETRAGHGMGKPTAKAIEEAADIFAFLLHHLRP
ncbi:MAG: prolyl oligopeptidase family serine peptidase [Actinomycetota bacterium]